MADLAAPPSKRHTGKGVGSGVKQLRPRVSFPEQYALWYYGDKLSTALLKNAPHSLLTLTEKAHGSGLISGGVRRELESLDPSVPHRLMCSYLLLHAQKNIDSDKKLMNWLELISAVESRSNVLSLVREMYCYLIRKSLDDCKGREMFVFKDFEVPALTEILASHSSKWEVIAISLELPHNEITNISARNISKPEVALNEVLLSWVNRGNLKHAKAPPTQENLEKALRSNLVGLGAVANQLREKLVKDIMSHSTLDFNVRVFHIVDQTKHVDVTEGNCALLEVQISGNHESNYQWSKKGNNDQFINIQSGKDLRILCIYANDFTIEGSYRCVVSCTNFKARTLISKPMHISVVTPIDCYQHILFEYYTRCREIPADSWPPVSTNSFINLALIKQDSIHKAGKYGRCTIRGDMDDIFKDKESITYDKALGGLSSGACLLIEGRPGCGKTTLVHKFSQDWAKKEITIKHVRLLFMIHLRGFCSDPNIGLRDLIGCYFSGSDVDVIEKYANKHQGLGLCFVLDGLDEYLPQNKNAFIFELIRNRVKNFPKSVVIVASRPAAAADFRLIVNRQIEVLGFLKGQIYDYIEKYEFSSPSKSHDGLRRYLDEHPNVLHMCYLPIHTCMVCFLYDNLESDLPQTETSIYAEFTKSTMLRMLYRDDSTSDMCIESLSDLPEPQNQLYVSICKLAFEMTKSSKQVMQQTEVKHFFKLQADRDSFGLITVDKIAKMCGFQKLYTFLHLTFQEFLAAFYVTSLDEEKQLELIEQFSDATQMKQVWKFYCGLVPFNGTSSTVIRLIDHSCHDPLFKIQCSFESQQPCTTIMNNNSLMLEDQFLTSSDLTAIAYVISNAQHQCVMKIVLDKCTIGMEGVEILVQKACGKLSLITTLCYHGYDCVTEQLSVVNRLMHSLPCLEILDISNTNLDLNELLALTRDLNHINLKILKVGSEGNPLYSSTDLPGRLAKRFSSGCPGLVNICFSGSYNACPPIFPFPFYFYCTLARLFLCFCKLRPIEVQVLSDDFKYKDYCTHLYLVGCGIDDIAASCLADGLKHCTHLEILDLCFNKIGDTGAVSLCNSVKCCHKLCRLNLSFNRVGDVGVCVHVARATKSLVYLCCNYITNTNDILPHVSGHNVDFHTLTFSGCTFGDSGVESILSHINDSKALCELSTKTVQCYSSVRVLDLSFNNISCHGAVALASCLKYFPHLKELNVSANNFEAKGAIAIASCLSVQLRKVDIGNNNISSRGARAIANALKHCVNLVELDISLNLMNDEGAIALAEALKHHKKLNISHNNIGSDGATAIADGLNHCSRLEELIVSHNNFRKDGACSIASSFCHYAQCLRKLDISYNNIGSKGCKYIVAALQSCVNLTELYLSHNSINADGVKAFPEALKHCYLHKLDLSNNKIGSEGCISIAALNHYTHLKELNVSDNFIGDVGVCALASHNAYLQKLDIDLDIDISNNSFGSEGNKAIKLCKHCVNFKV